MSEQRARLAVTTLWAGSAVAAAALLMLLPALPFAFAGTFAVSLVAAVLLLVGMVALLLPTGSVVAGSWVGSVALVVFGVLGLASHALGLLIEVLPAGGLLLVGTGLEWLRAAALTIGAIEVWRAGVLRSFARWVLFLPAAAYLLLAAGQSFPVGNLMLFVAIWQLWLILPLSLLLTGIALMVSGRGSVLRGRMSRIDREWRASTSVGGGTGNNTPLP